MFITGQVRTELIGTDGFQEADVTGITMPIVKHSMMIQDPREIPRGDPRGLPHRPHRPPRPGAGGRPAGPLARGHQLRAGRTTVQLPGYQPTTEGNAKQIRLAAKALANARRPVIYAGGGVVNADAAEELRRAVRESDRFPVTST